MCEAGGLSVLWLGGAGSKFLQLKKDIQDRAGKACIKSFQAAALADSNSSAEPTTELLNFSKLHACKPSVDIKRTF